MSRPRRAPTPATASTTTTPSPAWRSSPGPSSWAARLEEITDLVGIWDGERCGPVQKRFHDLVTDKLADAERQIAELTALSDQLRHAAAQLAGPAIDGPCSEGCACLALDGALAPVALTTKAAR